MLRSGVCLSVAVAMLGCGGSDRSKLAPVAGTVTYQEEPLATGAIVFYPEKGRGAAGTIVDGEITNVTTYEPGDGAPIGSHRLAITSVETEGEGTTAVSTPLIPVKYGDPAKSGLTAEIKAGKNVLEFQLKD